MSEPIVTCELSGYLSLKEQAKKFQQIAEILDSIEKKYRSTYKDAFLKQYSGGEPYIDFDREKLECIVLSLKAIL